MALDGLSSTETAMQRLWFECANIGRSDVRVEALVGREAISQPYRYEATLVSSRTIKAAQVVGQRGKLGIDIGDDSLVAQGVILELHSEDPTASGDFVYRVVLVPRLKLLDFTVQNQIYGTESPITLREIIQQTLDGSLARQSSHQSGRTMSIDGELRLTGSYRSRDHVVQYRESDLAFLSRSCEHAGVFFFFEQQDSGEVAVFGDANVAFAVAQLPGGRLSYRRDVVTLAESYVITSLRCEEKALPQRVYLNEYNDMLPSAVLLSQADVSRDGFGNVVEYGQNFLTPDEGSRLAEVRAQEIACGGRVLQGVSTAPQLRPGYVFGIKNHPDSRMDDRYIVTEVTHEAAQPFAVGQGVGVQPQAYQNRFRAIPLSVVFRPRRVTPQPVAPGLYSGVVDGAGSGDRAEIDQYGRYKVRFFYDDGTSPDGQATEYIRKAQPYAGKGDSGMHFPLLKGTEVALAYVNGDPDRPIILGALPNPLTPNVVTGSNSTRNRISSTTNVLFEIDDGPAGGGGSPGGGGPGGMGVQNHYAMEAASGPFAAEAGGRQAPDAADGPKALPPQNHFDSDTSDYSQATNYARISVPGSAASYLRLGVEADTDATTYTTGLTAQLTTPSSTTGQPVTTADGLYSSKPSTDTTVGDAYTDGVLLYTADDLVVKVAQSNLNLVGTGVTTEVTANDHYTNVKAGAFMVNASNGIYMTAGGESGGQATNIILTASGYVKTKSEGDSHVYSSSNSYTYIKGNKIQDVQGDNTSTVEGNNVSKITGTTTSTVIGASASTLIGAETVIKMAARFTSNLGIGMAINLALDMKIILGGEIVFQTPFGLKMTIGFDMKFVLGYDFKMVTMDTKLVTVSKYEIAPSTNNADGLKISARGIISDVDGFHDKKAAAKSREQMLDAIIVEYKSYLAELESHI